MQNTTKQLFIKRSNIVFIPIILLLSSLSCIHKEKVRNEVLIDSIFSESQNYSQTKFDFAGIPGQNVWEWPWTTHS
jgi:hypothetical protein